MQICLNLSCNCLLSLRTKSNTSFKGLGDLFLAFISNLLSYCSLLGNTLLPLSSMLNIGDSQNLACLIITWEMAKSTDSCPCWLVPTPSLGAWGWALFSTLNAFQFLQYQAFAVSSLLTVAHSLGRSQFMAHYCWLGSMRGIYLCTHHKAVQLQKLVSMCVNNSKLPGGRNRTHLAHLCILGPSTVPATCLKK